MQEDGRIAEYTIFEGRIVVQFRELLVSSKRVTGSSKDIERASHNIGDFARFIFSKE
jgi:hypothetical protein